jgi:MFS family permease
MTSELMSSFGIGAKDLGNLSAFYFYTYVAMQIPTGVLVDSWGATKLLIAGSISAGGGHLSIWSDRQLRTGMSGTSDYRRRYRVGWVVLLKLATHWFPAQRFAMLSGLGLFFGNIGALAAQVPLRLMIEHYGWRSVVLGSAGIVLAVSVLAWAVVRNDPPREDSAVTPLPRYSERSRLILRPCFGASEESLRIGIRG